jgi:hypothetical protein
MEGKIGRKEGRKEEEEGRKRDTGRRRMTKQQWQKSRMNE